MPGSSSQHTPAREIRPIRTHELRQLLRVVLAQPGGRAIELEAQIDGFLQYAKRLELPPEYQLAVFEGRRMVNGCATVIAPGRTATVLIPTVTLGGDWPAVTLELLQRAVDAGQCRGLKLLQVLVMPDRDDVQTVLEKAGFTFLADMQYMESDLTSPRFPSRGTPLLSWVPYSADTADAFAQTIAATYVGSLDCPRLAGMREITDIVAGHRATGEFAPSHWQLGLRDGDPVGTILVARVPGRSMFELVYMGLLPRFRGKGYGATLVGRGIELAREAGASGMVLAVDALNIPAQRLYEKSGFTKTGERRAWICVPPSCANHAQERPEQAQCSGSVVASTGGDTSKD